MMSCRHPTFHLQQIYPILYCHVTCLVDISLHQHCIFSSEATISANIGQKLAVHSERFIVHQCTSAHQFKITGSMEKTRSPLMHTLLKQNVLLWWYQYTVWQGIVIFRGWSIAYWYMPSPWARQCTLVKNKENAGNNCLQVIFINSVKVEPHIFSHCQKLVFVFRPDMLN